MKFAIFAVFSMAILVGCSTPETRQQQEVLQHRQHLEDQARTIKVNSSDGISEEEAYKIGRDRFDTYHTACGIVETPIDMGEYWSVTTCVGIIGVPFESILIRKSDGLTTMEKLDIEQVPASR